MYYAGVGISELEIPNQKSLVIYISECQNKCTGCHTPYLHQRYGDLLKENFEDIFNLYYNYFDVLCIMGEGKCTKEVQEEIQYYCNYSHNHNKQFALYSGRDCEIEDWMKDFDFIKVGAYKEEYGPLTIATTNQILYKKENNSFINITAKFWK